MAVNSFEKRKEASLRAARAQGIVDVVQASANDGICIDTLDLATRLTEKNASALYDKVEARRKQKE